MDNRSGESLLNRNKKGIVCRGHTERLEGTRGRNPVYDRECRKSTDDKDGKTLLRYSIAVFSFYFASNLSI